MTSLAIALLSRELLPEKYFYDSATINAIKPIAEGMLIGNSYNNMAYVYKIIDIDEKSVLNSLLFPGIFFFATLSILRLIETKNIFSLLLITFYACSTTAIYLSQYSKECIVLLLCLAFIYASKSKKHLAGWFLLAILYATYFRAYWVITLIVFLGNMILIRRGGGPLLLIFGIALLYFALSAAFPLFYGQELGQHRINANDDRLGSIDALTLITPTLQGSGIIIDAVNTLLQFILLLFPLPLALTGNLQHSISFLALSLISLISIKKFLDHHKTGELKRSQRLRASYSLLIATISVQAIFEPDYGSYIKHLSPLLIILIYTYKRERSTSHIQHI